MVAPTNPETRDHRIDRFITWGLTGVATVAFTVGGWSFTSLTSELHSLRDELSKSVARLSVVEALREVADKRFEALERRLELMEGGKK